MLEFAASRLMRALTTLWLVVSLVFFGMRLSGDPIELMLRDNSTPEEIARIQRAYGLDRPLPVQYVKYLERLARGDFGTSLTERRPATTVIRDRLPATLELAAYALFFSLALGIPAGIIAAVRRNGLLDRAIIGFAFIGQAVPSFFIAVMLIYLFVIHLDLLPSSGRGSWLHLVMPVIALTWGSLASVARITRVAVLEVLSADYVRTARSKGLSEQTIVVRHVLRNAAMPLLTMLGFMLGTAIAGAVVVEKVFAWPGMGRVLESAVMARDYPVIQLLVLIVAASVVAVNLIVDLAYGIVDPRVRGS